MLRSQSGLSHVLLPLQCLVLTIVEDSRWTFYLRMCKRSSWWVCFPDEFKAEQVLPLNCVLCVQCTELVTYIDSFPDAHVQFFPTATRALPWNSQKPQCWQWQIWLTFLQRKLKNLSKSIGLTWWNCKVPAPVSTRI